MGIFGSKRTEAAPLPDKEWNFAEILEEDAEACLRYELAREIKDPNAYFTVFKSREQAPFAIEPWPLTLQEERAASSEFKAQRATMCIRPFDVIDQIQNLGLREMLPGLYFSHPDGSCRACPSGLQETPWLGLDVGWQANFQLYTEEFLTGVALYSVREWRRWQDKHPGVNEELSESGRWQMLAMRIDWSKGDTSLEEGFSAWLKRQRPKEHPSTWLSGRQSTVDSLNALSALRLRHHYSIEDASRLTKSVVGKPLFNDRSSWDRAQRRAIQLFAKIFPGADTPRSGSKIDNRKG